MVFNLFVCLLVQAAEDGDEPCGHRNYISAALQTGLCDWSAKYFAQPVTKVVPPLFTARLYLFVTFLPLLMACLTIYLGYMSR